MHSSRTEGRNGTEAEPTDTVADVERTLSTFERDRTMNAMNFIKDEDGAVTVDWVVLTAAIVGLGLLVMNAVRPAISGLASDISTEVNKTGTWMKNQSTATP